LGAFVCGASVHNVGKSATKPTVTPAEGMRCRMEVLFFIFRLYLKDLAMHPQGRLYLVGAWLLVQVAGLFCRCLARQTGSRVASYFVRDGLYYPLCRTSSMSLRAAVNL
jgi:hypothetical protein